MKQCSHHVLSTNTVQNKGLAKNISINPLAEIWKCSTYEDRLGYLQAGISLALILQSGLLGNSSRYVGLHHKTKSDIPILVKLIEANDSVIVVIDTSIE